VWDPWYIVAFISGIINIFVCIMCYVSHKRKQILILRLLFDLIATFNGVCILIYSKSILVLPMVITDGLGVIREIIFMLLGDKKNKNPFAWFLLFEVLYSSSIFFIPSTNILSLLPIFANMLTTYALYEKNVKNTEIITIMAEILYITYNFSLATATDALSLINSICSVSMLIAAIIGLALYNKKAKKEMIL